MVLDRQKISLGITPTCWTNDDFPTIGEEISFEQCVSEIALAGFEGCSVGHKFPSDPVQLRAALELRGLRVSEPWVSTFFTANEMRTQTVENFLEQLEFIHAIGGTDIGTAELAHAVHQQPVAVSANKPVFDDRQWKAMVDGLNDLGARATKAGMRLCYHHHMGSGVQTRAEIDRLLADTDPDSVHLLLDTGHLTWAGDDPLLLIQDHFERIKHVHLKDIRRPVLEDAKRLGLSFGAAVAAGVFTVPGDGSIDFVPILKALGERDYGGWLVVEAEQDPAKAHPLTYAKKARAYLRDVAGL
jgi:inosose dehydratase